MFLHRLRRHRDRLPRGSRDLVTSSSWLVAASVLSQGSMLVANLLVANLLGVDGFGAYSLLQTAVVALAGLAQVSLALVVAQQVSSLRERHPQAAGEVATFCLFVTIILSLATMGGLLAARDQVAAGLFGDDRLKNGLLLVALATPWVALASVQQGLLTGLERFRDQAIVSVTLAPLVVLLPAAGALYLGLEGALAGLTGAYFLRAAASQYMIGRIFRAEGIPWSTGELKAKFRILSTYAVPATLAGILNSLAFFGGQVLLVRSPGGVADVGLFAGAYMVKTIVMFVPTQMIVALLPVLSRFHGRADWADGRQLLHLNLAASLAVTIVLAAPGILLSSRIMALFGPEFSAGGSALAWLLIGTPLEAATTTLYQDLQSRGLFWKTLRSFNIPLAFTVVIGGVALIPSLKTDGLAIAWLIGWTVALAGTLLAVRSKRLVRKQ